MALTLPTASRDAMITALRDESPDGKLKIYEATKTTLLVEFGLSATGGSISGGVWTLAFDATTVAASATGTADQATITTSADVVTVDDLNVGDEITIDNTSITSGQNVTVTSATITQNAS